MSIYLKSKDFNVVVKLKTKGVYMVVKLKPEGFYALVKLKSEGLRARKREANQTSLHKSTKERDTNILHLDLNTSYLHRQIRPLKC
jgi:hypothetical protein